MKKKQIIIGLAYVLTSCLAGAQLWSGVALNMTGPYALKKPDACEQYKGNPLQYQQCRTCVEEYERTKNYPRYGECMSKMRAARGRTPRG